MAGEALGRETKHTPDTGRIAQPHGALHHECLDRLGVWMVVRAVLSDNDEECTALGKSIFRFVCPLLVSTAVGSASH